MSEKISEELSALVDGELEARTASRVIAELAGDPALRQAWGRCQLIGTALRHGLPERFDSTLAERVMQGIGDSEPEPGAPPLPLPGTVRGWLKPVAGVAIAASVAALAIVGVQVLGPGSSSPGNAVLVSQAPPAPSTRTVTSIQPVNVELDRERLARYLQRHNEFITNRGVNGVLPYVRVVSQDHVELPVH